MKAVGGRSRSEQTKGEATTVDWVAEACEALGERVVVRRHRIGPCERVFITLDFNGLEFDLAVRLYEGLLSWIHQHCVRVIYEKGFGLLEAGERLNQVRKQVAAAWGRPLGVWSWIEGKPLAVGPLSSLCLCGLSGPLEEGAVRVGGRAPDNSPIGIELSVEGARQLYVFGLATRPASSVESELEELFARLAEQVRECGFEGQDLARTWFYLKDIGKDYAKFNEARRAFFQAQGIAFGPQAEGLPASTCIQGTRQDASAAVDLLCVDRTRARPKRQRLRTPLQNEAEGNTYLFQPTFSRAMLLEYETFSELQVSGTASVDAQGQTLHAGDSKSQILRTLRTVRELLKQGGMTFSSVCQATAFFKRPADWPHFQPALEELGIEPFCCTFLEAEVCRGNLLFELDAIAVTPLDLTPVKQRG